MTSLAQIPLGFQDEPEPRATARRSDPVTSHIAAAMMRPKKLKTIQRDVLDFFRRVGEGTDEDLELALKAKHPGFSSLRKRRSELVERGFLSDTGRKKENAGGRPMIIWKLNKSFAVPGNE